MDQRVSDDPLNIADRLARVLHLRNGRRLGFAEYGAPDGQPVVALHGTPGARTMFAVADQAARAKGIRIIAPDRAGYGLSEAHHFDTLADTAGDIEALADWLGLDRFTLAGYSGGAPHALAAALLMGDRIERVALISPVGLVADGAHVPMTSVQHFIFSYLGHSQFAARMYFHGVRSMMAWLPGGAEMLVTQYASASDRAILCRPGLRELLDLTMHEGLCTSVDGAVQDLRLYCRPWGLPLHELETPAHIWQGAADTIVAPEAAYQLAKALPNCTLEVLQDMGHYWLFGAFEGILETIREKPRQDFAPKTGLRTWFGVS